MLFLYINRCKRRDVGSVDKSRSFVRRKVRPVPFTYDEQRTQESLSTLVVRSRVGEEWSVVPQFVSATNPSFQSLQRGSLLVDPSGQTKAVLLV